MSIGPASFRAFRRFPGTSKRGRLLAVLVLLSAGSILCPAPSAWAFGCQAHEIVALIAKKHLTPHALSMVQQILKDGPIDPGLSRFCKEKGLDAMAYVSTWADDYRSAHRETAPWHQIDIPIGVSKGKTSDFCPPSEVCLPQAIRDQLAILRTHTTDPQKRADALRFVIHFIGDLHQPLHTSNNNDLGGNCVPVVFFGDSPKLTYPDTESYAPNLHTVWDYGILSRMMGEKTVQQTADEFDRDLAQDISQWMHDRPDVEAWTWESLQIAEIVVYGKLPVTIPVEAPITTSSCAEADHISTRMLNLNEQIGPTYQDAAAPVVKQQLVKAGARLALLLNQLWP